MGEIIQWTMVMTNHLGIIKSHITQYNNWDHCQTTWFKLSTNPIHKIMFSSCQLACWVSQYSTNKFSFTISLSISSFHFCSLYINFVLFSVTPCLDILQPQPVTLLSTFILRIVLTRAESFFPPLHPLYLLPSSKGLWLLTTSAWWVETHCR